MKKISLISMIALGITACGHEETTETEVAVIDTQDQKVSYLMGIENGKGIGSTGINLDLAAYQQGFADGVAKLESKLDDEEASKVIQEFQKQMMAKRDEMQKAEQESAQLESAANLDEGKAFLAANGAKEGIVTTESGLQYKVITAGTGEKPSVESTVEVHYAGSLLDGTEFDSSIKRGNPVKFGVTQVIPGWTEALQLMPEGSKWELYIPADLGYGAGGQGPIGPNAVLIFEVELLSANVSKAEKG
ncbi:MAG: FKBP-type peptidyl-prolyl cis-trans isomerase [Porticoccaceae bacterium]|nr:FKBP-type peptidyl-prolyl cis-trans isomerase [Porticoccaceae bacterium]